MPLKSLFLKLAVIGGRKMELEFQISDRTESKLYVYLLYDEEKSGYILFGFTDGQGKRI